MLVNYVEDFDMLDNSGSDLQLDSIGARVSPSTDETFDNLAPQDELQTWPHPVLTFDRGTKLPSAGAADIDALPKLL